MEATGCVYTVITGGYDHPPQEPVERIQGWDYLLFTDDAEMRARGWDVQPVTLGTVRDAADHSRAIKILFRGVGYMESLYVDANITFSPKILDHLRCDGFGVFAHSQRQTVAQEFDACVRLKKCTNAAADAHRAAYKQGILQLPLTDNGIIYRRHTDDVQKLCRAWWDKYLRHDTRRDQLSLQAASVAAGVPIHIAPQVAGLYKRHKHKRCTSAPT